MRQQCVLVREEGLRADLIGARYITEHQVEPRGAGGHVRQGRVQPDQLAVHLFGVALGVGRGERDEVIQHVGENQTGERGIVRARAEDVLDRPVGPVAGLTELVHVVPVAVLRQVRRAGAVEAAVQQPPRVELVEQRRKFSRVRRHGYAGVIDGQLGQLPGDIRGVQQHDVVGARPVECP